VFTVTSVSEMIVIFVQLILFANTAAFFCSLLGLDSLSYSFWKGDSGETRWSCFKYINLLLAYWLFLRKASLQTGFSYLQRYT